MENGTLKSKTIFRNTVHGNLAKTVYMDVNGYDWELTTMKRSNGNISTFAQAGKFSDNKQVFTYQIFREPNHKLFEGKGRATKSNILNIHQHGLSLFEDKYQV